MTTRIAFSDKLKEMIRDVRGDTPVDYSAWGKQYGETYERAVQRAYVALAYALLQMPDKKSVDELANLYRVPPARLPAIIPAGAWEEAFKCSRDGKPILDVPEVKHAHRFHFDLPERVAVTDQTVCELVIEGRTIWRGEARVVVREDLAEAVRAEESAPQRFVVARSDPETGRTRYWRGGVKWGDRVAECPVVASEAEAARLLGDPLACYGAFLVDSATDAGASTRSEQQGLACPKHGPTTTHTDGDGFRYCFSAGCGWDNGRGPAVWTAIDEAALEINKLKRTLAEKDGLIAELQARYDEVQVDAGHFVNERNARIRELEERFEALSRAKDAMAAELNEKDERVRALVRNVGDAKEATINELRQRLDRIASIATTGAG